MSNCSVIALCNQKGGIGKTTACFNFGVGLAMRGKRVLMIDGDKDAYLTTNFVHSLSELNFTLSDVFQKVVNNQTVEPKQGILHHDEGVFLMPSNNELENTEMNIVKDKNRTNILKTYIDAVKKL